MACTGQSKICIFGRNFLIGHSIFRREKPFADEEQHVKFGHSLPETSKSSAFWDMGVKSHQTWLLLFSPDAALANRRALVYNRSSQRAQIKRQVQSFQKVFLTDI